MPSAFDLHFASAGFPMLLSQFGEPVTYYSKGIGTGRPIEGIVERDVQVVTDQGIPALQTYVTVKNDGILGISSTEIDTGRDTCSISLRIGESPQVRQIVRVVSTEHGQVRFEVN